MSENGGNGTNGTVTNGYGSLASNREAMDEFLSKMRNSGNVRASCEAAGIPRTTAYRWRDKWVTFAAEWDEAKSDAVDWLDLEAWKRATKGQSDRLLMFLLQAHRPEVYKPVQNIKHSGTGEGGAIKVDGARSDYHARALAALANTLGGLMVGGCDGEPGAMDATEQSTVGSGPESGG